MLPLVIRPDTSIGQPIGPQEWRMFTPCGWGGLHPGPGNADEERCPQATPNA
jgi:hypothetical protein